MVDKLPQTPVCSSSGATRFARPSYVCNQLYSDQRYKTVQGVTLNSHTILTLIHYGLHRDRCSQLATPKLTSIALDALYQNSPPQYRREASMPSAHPVTSPTPLLTAHMALTSTTISQPRCRSSSASVPAMQVGIVPTSLACFQHHRSCLPHTPPQVLGWLHDLAR